MQRAVGEEYIKIGVLQKGSIHMRRFLRYVLFLCSWLALFCFVLLILGGFQEFTDTTMAILYYCMQINLSCLLLFLPLILLLRLRFTYNRRKNMRRVVSTLLWMLLIFSFLNLMEIFYTFTTYGKIK